MSSSANASLKSLLSCCDNNEIYLYASRVTPELALLGYTDVAARLLIELNNYDFYHDQFGNFKSLSGFSGIYGVPWPGDEEEKVRQAVRQRRAKTSNSGNGPGNGVSVTYDDVKRELERVAKDLASKWYYPTVMPGSDRAVALNPHKLDCPPAARHMLESAKDIIHSLKTARPAPNIRDVRSGLVSALELVSSAEADHEEAGLGMAIHRRGAPCSKRLLRWLARSLGERSYETRPATESRQAWKLYITRALRQHLNIDEAALTGFADNFEDALTERLKNGRSRPTSHLSISELLKAAEHNTHTNPKAQDYKPQPHDTSLFHAPGTESQIQEAEARLGITLPTDYKAFLRVSNGFGSAWGHPLGDFQPPLHSIDRLRWLDLVEEDYFTDLTLDMPARWARWPFAPPPTAKPYAATDDDALEHFLVGRALELGTEGIDNLWLLSPWTVGPIKEAVKSMLEDEGLGEREG